MKPPTDTTTPDAPENPQTAVGGRPSTPCSGFFIVNDHDAPRFEMIAELRHGMLHYIHPKNSGFGAMSPISATPIESFGMIADVKAGILVILRDESAPVTATYADGKPRKWQGGNVFSFSHQNATAQGLRDSVTHSETPTDTQNEK